MSKNVVEPEGPHTSKHGAFALHAGSARLHANTCKHPPKYVIIIAFPRQQWFCESASLLRYTYIDCLVIQLNSVP
jgi:hypothetical protein